MDIALFCYSKDTKDPSLLTKWTFNMSLFLSVYYEVFLRQNNDRSKTMTEVLLEKMSQYVEPKYLNFILWLAKPSSSDPYGKNLTSYDKLKQFFVQDEKHRAHVHCIIQLAAVIFGNTEHSCHLYDHLFNPKDISTDFIPGSVILAGAGTCYSQVMNVSKNNSLYYTSRKSLTWHSLLFTQWMNYGMLCFSIITGPSKARHLQFHHQPSLVTVCLNNLKSLWEILTTDCCLAFEDTALLASYGAQNVYKVLKSNRINNSWQCLLLRKNSTEGWKTVLSENDQLDSLSRYEKILHNEVFRPSWDSMKSLEKFVSFGKTIGKHMRELTASVPELNIRSVDPLRAFLMTVLSSTNICNTSCPFYVLYQFILCRPSLNVAAELLPSLVDLYNWINTRLTHKVTSDIAKSNSVGVVLESILQQFFPQDKHKMQNAIELYLNYKKLISDDSISQLPALNLQMSFYDLVTTVDGKDTLFQLINLLVKQYNEFVQMFHQHFSSKHYFGEHFSSTKIPLTEVIQRTCAFGTSKSHHDLKDMEEIILKYCSMDVTTKNRSMCCDGDDTILSDCVPEVFSLTGIQNEVIQMFIFHKQFIDIENFRKKFAFSEVSLYGEAPHSLFYTATYGHEDTVERLDKFADLKIPLDDELIIYDFTSTFHSLSYDSLLSVCGGLCLILKMLLEKAEVAQEEILTLTVQSFLTKYYFSDSNSRVLSEVGIVINDTEHIRSGLTVNQYNQLCSAPVTVVASISELFHEWVKIGFYDFSHLPHSMKIPIRQNDDRSEPVQEWIEGNDEKTIKDVMHLLFKFEQLFCQAENHNTKKMSDILKDKTIINRTNADVIVSLPIQYYVYIQLRFRNKLLDNSRGVQEKQHNTVVENFINITPEPVEKIDKELEHMPLSPPAMEYKIPLIDLKLVEEPNNTTSANDNDTEVKLEQIAESMTSEDVAQFLDKEGFTESAQIVRENDDNGSTLYSVTQQHNIKELAKFGVITELDKLKFCVIFRRELTIRAGLELSVAAAKYGPKELAKFLKEIRRAEPFAKICEDKGIDGEMLLQAENRFFRELHVPGFVQEKIIHDFKNKIQEIAPHMQLDSETNLRNQVRKLQKELYCEFEKVEDLVKANSEKSNTIDKLQQEVKTLYMQLENERKTSFDAKNQANELQKEIDSMEKANIVKTNQVDSLQQEVGKLQLQLDREKSMSTTLMNEVIELQEKLHHWVVERNEIEMTEIPLGKGAWGEVKVAKFRGLKVAAKCLYRTILSDFNLALFNREMEISSRLHHPNLIQFLGATQEGNPIILTELMTTTLRSELEKTSLTRPQIIKIAQEVSLALNYLHLYKPKPILHRDVSNSNVLLDPTSAGFWKAKLSDFGSANFLHKISPNSAAGAPLYLAPEAPYPDLHSTAMDVYSFGAILMEMVLKQPPCETTHERETQSKNIEWKPMKAIVQKCLSHDYKKRPSILQVHNDFEKL